MVCSACHRPRSVSWKNRLTLPPLGSLRRSHEPAGVAPPLETRPHATGEPLFRTDSGRLARRTSRPPRGLVRSAAGWASFCPLVALLWLGGLVGSLAAQTIETRPVDGLHENTPQRYALTGAKLVVTPDKVVERGVLIVDNGVIVQAGADLAIPADARVIDLKGKTVYPGLIDAYGETTAKLPSGGSPHWNSLVTPQLAVADQYQPDEGLHQKLRSQGFTARLVAPAAGIIKGMSALVLTDGSASTALLRRQVAQHLRLTISRGGSRDQYPNSPMGAVALARQVLYDADWYVRATAAATADTRLLRPVQDDALAALQAAVVTRIGNEHAQAGTPGGTRWVGSNHASLFIADAPNELYFLRADRFAREFGLPLIVRGSGHEYKRLDAIRAAERPVIVPLQFPEAPYVGTVEAAMDVSLERLMHWDLAPENPARLERAGVTLMLTSFGLRDAGSFLVAIRQAVRRGLSADGALRALTITPAQLFGVADRLGTLEPGKLANLVITDGPLFDAETKVIETWVQGRRHRFVEPLEHDPRGDWELTYRDAAGKLHKGLVQLTGKSPRFTGSIRVLDAAEKLARAQPAAPAAETPPADTPAAPETAKPQSSGSELKQLQVGETHLSAVFDAKEFGRDGLVQMTAVRSQGTAGPRWIGTLVWSDGVRMEFTAVLKMPSSGTGEVAPAGQAAQPERSAEPNRTSETTTTNTPSQTPGEAVKNPAAAEKVAAEAAPADQKKEDEARVAGADRSRPATDTTNVSSFPVNYPLGAFGRSQHPEQPAVVLFRNATVWTCGAPPQVMDGASVLVESGRIVAVGPDLPIPAHAVIIDCTGKHLTPGIIDCHSHMATDGGINESSQAITAEVRIADFIDADDIAIYWQLAGGVTAANVLHGSANPIGGQNQVIKLRWGALPEEMKFDSAPAGIKFALGENVKQSNWGEQYTRRYPQSRMGVEQIIRDAFGAARDYRRTWEQWQKDRSGIPPRRDLELDALDEVLRGQRWVHCHSYRQDEILALLRTADDFGVRIGSLQHILEGYKVADAMAAHGATGSAFSDWWAYKFEVIDAIPYAGALMHQAGVVVSFNSDDRELARHLNQEAAKAVKYGGVPPREALQFVTLNPAKQLRIDHQVGSLEPGKDADLVVWSGPPLSNFSRCEQTWIDGRRYFDRNEDLQARQQADMMRATLIQKILTSGTKMRAPGESDLSEEELWPREDLFCHHGHDDEHEHHHAHQEEAAHHANER